MKRGIIYIALCMMAVLSCMKGEPVDDMSGFHKGKEAVSVIPDGGSKVISFVVDDDIAMETKSGINPRAEVLKPETFATSSEDWLKSGGSVSVSMEKSFLPGYSSSVDGVDTKGSNNMVFQDQVTDLNSFHVYAYTPGNSAGSTLTYAWDEDFTKGSDGVFRSASSREWPDTDPEWTFIATNVPSQHLYRINPAGSSSAFNSFGYYFQLGSSQPYNPVPDAMFAFNYNNTRAEWANRTTLQNNGSTGYTLSTYKSRNTLSFKHLYARIGSVTVVNQTGQNVRNVNIRFAGNYVSNCYSFGYGTGSLYYIAGGSWGNKSNNNNWINSFGPTSAGTVEEGLYCVAPTSLLFYVSWEADEPGNGHQTYTDIPVTVTGFRPGINYNLTFTLGMGGVPVPETHYFKLYVVSAGPGASDCLVFGSQSTALSISYFPTLYYSLDDGVTWNTFATSKMCIDGKCYFHTSQIHQGDYILLKGNLESNPAGGYFGDRYFMFADYTSLTASDNATRSLQPASIAAAYAMGEMKTLAEGRVVQGMGYKAGDFTDIFNADLPLSVGSVLYSHPAAYDYFNDPEYNIIAPWSEDITSSDRNEFHHDEWNMTRCFKGTHLSYMPYNGECTYTGTHTPWVYTRCIWTQCFGSCNSLIDDAVLDIHHPYYKNIRELRSHANKDNDYMTLAAGSPLDDFFSDMSDL